MLHTRACCRDDFVINENILFFPFVFVSLEYFLFHFFFVLKSRGKSKKKNQ